MSAIGLIGCPDLSVEPEAYHKDRGGCVCGRADRWPARDRDRTALSFLPGCAP